jgi:hypothetical protein
MPSINVVTDTDAKELVGTLAEDGNELQTNQIDLNSNPEISKDYNNLINKPTINGVELRGDIDSDNLNILRPLTDAEIDQIMVVS